MQIIDNQCRLNNIIQTTEMENTLQYDIFGSEMLNLSTPPRNTHIQMEDEPEEYS